MAEKIVVGSIFEQYLPDGKVTRKTVRDAYREAAVDLHPDQGGNVEDFIELDEEADRLEEEMEEDVLYEAVTTDSVSDSGLELSDSGETYDAEDEFYSGLRRAWERGLREVNPRLGSSYEIVTYREIGEKAISRFEDGSDLSFAINAEIEGELFTHETNYFFEGERIDSYVGSRFSYEVFNSERYLQEIAEDAVERAKLLKSQNEEFFDL